MEKLAIQSGIIPYRLERDVLQVLLITTRKTGRWVIPKGNIGKGHNARQAAEREAHEEAGVRGDVEKVPLGSYIKRSSFTEPDMILGADFFAAHRVYIARRQGRMYFT